MEFTGEINDSDIADIAQDVVENYDFTYTIEAVLDYDAIARYVEGEIDVTAQVEDVISVQRFVDEDDVQRLIDTALSYENDAFDEMRRRITRLEKALEALADALKPDLRTATTYPTVDPPIVGG